MSDPTSPSGDVGRPACPFLLRMDAPDIPPIAPGPVRSVRPLEMAGSRFAIIQDPLLAGMRILVIEDETKVGCFIKRALEEESYAVDLCEDGAKGLEMALTTNYDSIIVDLMLPSLSGLDIVKGIRRERIQTPILILTAQSQVDQRVKGLDAGADDYLTKPFAIDELLARVRALLRRGATDSPGILQIDDLVLNPATREVTRGGQRIELTLKEYALLEYLMRHTGRVLTRPMISEHVWNQDFDTFTNVIDVYVNYLRNKVDRGRTKKLIHTIRGSGYMLKAD